MTEKEITAESVEDGELNEELIEDMFHLEEELVGNQYEIDREVTVDTMDTFELEDEIEEKEPSVTGTIRTVTKKDDKNRFRIRFVVNHEIKEDTITADSEEPINRLCCLCGVPEGRVSNLQGKSVPVVYDSEEDEYNLKIPSAGTKPAIAVFRAWQWCRRNNVPNYLDTLANYFIMVMKPLSIPLLLLWAYPGMKTWSIQLENPSYALFEEIPLSSVVPFVSSESLNNLPYLIEEILFALVTFSWIVAPFMFIGILLLSFVAVVSLGEYIDEKINPF